MTGHHPWKKLLEETFSPEERAEIAVESEKMARAYARQQQLSRAARVSSKRTAASPASADAAASDLPAD